MSQCGTVPLAQQGLTPLQILHRFYPRDLELVTSDNIRGITESFPGTALSLGSSGPSVQRMQMFLNRIRVNFPLIPRITNPNGTFETQTQAAVRTFQQIFNLAQNGVLNRETWNRISSIHVGVTRLAELDSEGTRITIGQAPPNVVLSQGSRGENVIHLQFLLSFISQFNPAVPTVIKDGVFGVETRNAVIDFQRAYNLATDGVVGPNTWNRLYAVYRGIQNSAPIPPNPAPPAGTLPPFPGTLIQVGARGDNVRQIQRALNTIRTNYPGIPQLVEDGIFGPITRSAVIAFQQEFVLTADGIVGPVTWGKLAQVFYSVTGGVPVAPPVVPPAPPVPPAAALPPYPGTLLRVGSRGESVRQIQRALNVIRTAHPGIPQLAEDGIFGPITQSAVIAFQRIFGLSQDGIVGPVTWGRLAQELQNMSGAAPAPTPPGPTPAPLPSFPGTLIRVGSTGANVRLIQSFLNTVRIAHPNIPQLVADGIFGPITKSAVTAFQRQFGLTPDGIVGPVTWGRLMQEFRNVAGTLEYPGTPLRVGSGGQNVRLMQTFLMNLRPRHQSIPQIKIDGIFGPKTQSAVVAFQRLFGLAPDGIIGPLTWNAIVTQHNRF